jgi:hypothetical protein
MAAVLALGEGSTRGMTLPVPTGIVAHLGLARIRSFVDNPTLDYPDGVKLTPRSIRPSAVGTYVTFYKDAKETLETIESTSGTPSTSGRPATWQ